MKVEWIKLCALLLTMLGFTSCGIVKKAADAENPEESPAVEQPAAGQNPQAEPDTTVKVSPGIRVMYGPPPASYRK